MMDGSSACSNIIDEFTHECLAIRVSRRLKSSDVIDALSDLFIRRGVPEFIRSDNGPEFIAQAVQDWIGAVGSKTAYISPGSPTQGITLSCASITPLVTIPPVCSFTQQPVKVNGTPVTSTLTINTAGPITTGSASTSRSFYSLWIPLPMLALAGLGAAAGGKRTRKAWGLLALFVVSGSLLLMPACGNSSTSSTTPNGITPANTYTFTIVGVDIDGNISSNTNSNGTNPSVSLSVTAPSKVP